MESVHFIEVAVPRPLMQAFTYKSHQTLSPGVRVRVPFGKGSEIGVVLGISKALRDVTIKSIKEILDENPIYSPQQLELARWLAHYYVHPIGEVLKAMLPASQNHKKKQYVIITNKGLESSRERALAFVEETSLVQIFAARKSYSLAQFKKKIKGLGESDLFLKWIKLGFIELHSEDQVNTRSPSSFTSEKDHPPHSVGEVSKTLSQRQAEVKEGISVQWKGKDFRPLLLFGVTGAGKTEIYLQLIAERPGQVLVMVPEIALTPQMTMVFEKRFPDQVAVVHSALTDSARWVQLDRMRRGECRILIGPRSAVFANFSDLQLIIVDEEHDSSYKQTVGLCYQGRDTAIMRAKQEGIPVLLGSATPSMESWQNAAKGKFALQRLEERVSGKPLPDVKLIKVASSFAKAMKVSGAEVSESERLDEIPISEEVIIELGENLSRNQQSIVLVNRRGYAYYLLDFKSGEVIQCPSCSISLTLHGRSTKLFCHYCGYKTSVKSVLEKNPNGSYVAIGYGSEKAYEVLKAKFPLARIGRLDSDIASDRKVLSETLNEFRIGNLDILVGTQILAKGHDFPNVTLVVLLEVDQLLNLPDFRAGEKTFQLLVQAAGRAGRHELPGRVLVQSTKGTSPILHAGLSHDFPAFVEAELNYRKAFHYPPFTRMIALEWSSTFDQELSQMTQKVEKWLDGAESHFKDLRFLGPSAPAIEMIRGRHRMAMVLVGENVSSLNQGARKFLEDFSGLKGDLRLKVDVDPMSLL
jgi:primosomal protein N' (replication factor Y)